MIEGDTRGYDYTLKLFLQMYENSDILRQFHLNTRRNHISKFNILKMDTCEHVELQNRESAFNRRIRTFAIVNKDHIDLRGFLNDAFNLYWEEVFRTLQEHNIIKTSTVLISLFEKTITDLDNPESNRVIPKTLYSGTKNKVVSLNDDLNEHYQRNIANELVTTIENAELQGSGFIFTRVIELDVNICSYQPIGGSSFIPTPTKLKAKRSLVNVKNEDDEMCFKWAVLAAIKKVPRNRNRVRSYYEYKDDLNFEGINFPVRLNQIDKFVRQNDISINVYYYDDEIQRVCPLRVSAELKSHHIHLLLVTDKPSRKNAEHYKSSSSDLACSIKAAIDTGLVKSHYILITDFSTFINRQVSKRKLKGYVCDRCLSFFNNEWLYFKNHHNQVKAPFVIYADTEAYMKHLSDEERKLVFSEGCSTTAYDQHRVYSVGYYFKCEFDDTRSYYACSPPNSDSVEWFIKKMEEIANAAAEEFSNNTPMIELTEDEIHSFENPRATCWVCDLPFSHKNKRVRDHCHFSGLYRGAAHAKCNLQIRQKHVIPIVMHNLSGYDSHLFIKQLALNIKGDITIIPNNAENYISFTKVVDKSTRKFEERVKLKFIDSCRFMPASLSELASLLPADKKRILRNECTEKYSLEQIAMLERKGVFPYDYIDCVQRLQENKLPSKEKFYSKLNEEGISDQEYQFAIDVWEKFQCNTLWDYSHLYLKTDVLLLADVFENFRETCHTIYKLDPANYYTAPGLSWDAMLKFTRIHIELLTDPDMLLFIERGIRGGISQCSRRYNRANNKYMEELYNPKEESSYLMYLDGELS